LAQPVVATADVSEPVAVEDPQYGEVLFHFYQRDYFQAIVRLLAAQQQSRLGHHQDEAELLLGGLYLSYGHHLRAAEIFERLLAANVKPEIRDRTWFFLAKIWNQRAYPGKAQEALDQIEGDLPQELDAERRMLQAELYIGRGEYDRAIAMLGEWQGTGEWAGYAKFNLGVAMVRSGRVQESAAILDQLGRLESTSEEQSALRDKANLALGYAFLQDGQPVAAMAPLQRIRLSGPFSNKALLGVGWADAELGHFDRALVPWMELENRDLLDSAVQESLLAIPYAMAKLDSISEAADRYLNAIAAFHGEADRLDRTIDRIERGVLIEEFLAADARESSGWYWRLDELPDAEESRYLYHLLATHEFQEGLKNYRDLRYLADNLDDWQNRVEVFRDMLETRQLAYDQRLPRVMQSLAQADIERLVDRKLEFDAALNNIEKNGDTLALATVHEFELWSEITRLRQSPALAADSPEAAARDKMRLLEGVLQWQLDREFKARLSSTRRDVRRAGEALVETQRARRSVDQAMRDEPLLFAEFSRRIDGLSPRIDGLESRVRTAMDRQRAFLQAIAVDELEAQKSRLETYTVQARFALAAIYDLSSTVGDASQ
jgi:hypothetical protein